MLSCVCPSGADLARDERALQRQLGCRERERLASEFFGDAVDLIEHLARLNLSHVVLRVALAVAHADFGWLLRDRLVRGDADPDAAATLHVTRNRATCSLDLARRQTAAPGRLQAAGPQPHRRPPG